MRITKCMQEHFRTWEDEKGLHNTGRFFFPKRFKVLRGGQLYGAQSRVKVGINGSDYCIEWAESSVTEHRGPL
jgi:hypothetical protein